MDKLKRGFFVILAKINKWVVPTMTKKDFNRLSNTDKLIIGYRYWVTKNSLRD